MKWNKSTDYLAIRRRRHQDVAGDLVLSLVRVPTRSDECKVCPVKNTWTILFVCLSRTNDQEVPTTSGKITLSLQGLAKKRSYFKRMEKAAMFSKSSWKNFLPWLKVGDFKFLEQRKNSARKLTALPIPPGGYTVPYLKSILEQARGFIRPLQRDLCLQKHEKRYCYRKLYTGVSHTVWRHKISKEGFNYCNFLSHHSKTICFWAVFELIKP